jgi:hypothetical protein
MLEGSIFTEKGERRIFEGELVAVSGGRARVRGFHLEDAVVMCARGIVIDEATRTAPDGRGVYLARITMQGAKRMPASSGFFPLGWSRESVRTAITEAYQVRKPRRWVEAGNFYAGRSRSGVLIIMELDERGRVLDAFPMRARNANNRKRDAKFRVERGVIKKSRLVCGQCRAAKVMVCPNGHNSPFEVLRWYYRLRYLLGRIVRGLVADVRGTTGHG